MGLCSVHDWGLRCSHPIKREQLMNEIHTFRRLQFSLTGLSDHMGIIGICPHLILRIICKCVGLIKIESYLIGFSGKPRFRRANQPISPWAMMPLFIWKSSVGPDIALQLRVIQIPARNKSRLIRFIIKQIYERRSYLFDVLFKYFWSAMAKHHTFQKILQE